MRIEQHPHQLQVRDLTELSAINAGVFHDEIHAALPVAPGIVEIDLSHTQYIDSSGLGALFTLYKNAGSGQGLTLRLLNPSPPVQQLFELTHMHELFEIVQRTTPPEPNA